MAGKREPIEPIPGDKRSIRRDDKGRIEKSVDVGNALAQDARQHAKTVVEPRRGDKDERAKKS